MMDKYAILYDLIENRKWDEVTLHVQSDKSLVCDAESSQTPLNAALENGANLDLIRLFIDQGADVNAPGMFNSTPLEVLCIKHPNRLELIQYLVDKGAILYPKSPFRNSLLCYAAQRGDVAVLSYFVKELGFDVNHRNGQGTTPLMFAAMYNSNPLSLTFLIENGAEIDAADDGGNRSIMFAAQKNPLPDILDILVNNGASIEPYRKTNVNLFHCAAYENGNPAIIDYLIDRLKLTGINHESDLGYTPLFYAARYNDHIGILERLLERGADPCFVSSKHERAIHVASTDEKKNVLRQAMIERGCDPNEKIKPPPPQAKNKRSKKLNLLKLVLVNEESDKTNCPYADQSVFFKDCNGDLICSWESAHRDTSSSGLYDFDLSIPNPTMEHLNGLIDYLDGETNSTYMLTLVKNDTEYMAIYGGLDGWFTCFITLDAKTDDIWNLKNNYNKDGEQQHVRNAPGECEFEPTEICDRETMKKIAKYYAENGKKHPSFSWVR